MESPCAVLNFLFLDPNGDQKPNIVLLEDGDLYPDPYRSQSC